MTKAIFYNIKIVVIVQIIVIFAESFLVSPDLVCKDTEELTGSNGTIKSLGYPLGYGNLLNCRWHIKTNNGDGIRLEFADVFDVEGSISTGCLYDSLSIFQEGKLIPVSRLCGSKTPDPVLVPGREVRVQFQSDNHTTGKGFRIYWSTYTDDSPPDFDKSFCLVPTRIQAGSGYVFSPDFQDGGPYPAPSHKCWQIKVLPGYSIALQFDHLDVGEWSSSQCRGAVVRVYDGLTSQSPLIGEYCSSDILPGQLMSSSNGMYIAMIAASNDASQRGFNAQFFAIRTEITTTSPSPLPPGCNSDQPVVLNSTFGLISSPGYDRNSIYPNDLTCNWVLQAPPGQVFFIKFNAFMLEPSADCSMDYLSISDATLSVDADRSNSPGSFHENTSLYKDYNKTEMLMTACGYQLPYDIETNGEIAVITFYSDDQVGGLGFELAFASGTPTLKCEPNQFRCDNVKCIDWASVCDGFSDCKNGGDEIACPNSDKCGRPSILPVVSRIVGGDEAARGAWPWTVSVLDIDRKRHLCGATLITPEWVVGAAHCFTKEYNRNYTGYSVRAGRHNLNILDRNEQTIGIAEVISRRDFVDQWSLNDLALIRLEKPFTIGMYVSPVCLPSSSVIEGSPCYISGWGETLNTCCRDALKQAMVPIINNTDCASAEYYGDRFRERMFCAGYPDGGIDACGGDSGGPLVCPSSSHSVSIPATSTRWQLQGVTSWGVLCAVPKKPGVYTAVYDYVQWIQQTIALHTPLNNV